MKKFLITILILAFLVGGGALGAYIYRSNKRNSNPVNVYSVSNWLGNYYDMETSLSGNIVLSDEQTVYIERDKIIKEIHATPGDAVKVDEFLVDAVIRTVEILREDPRDRSEDADSAVVFRDTDALVALDDIEFLQIFVDDDRLIDADLLHGVIERRPFAAEFCFIFQQRHKAA